MRATWLYRTAAFFFALFALGHTFGFLKFKPPSAEGLAVLESMNRVHFQVGSATFSYGGFYVGFGLSITLSLLFSAFLSWHLGGLARSAPKAIGALGWAFFLLQVGGVILSWMYFSLGPTILSAAVAVCLGWANLAVASRHGEG